MIKKTLLALALAMGLTVGAISAPANAADEPLYLPAPVQIDECGPEADPYAAFDIPEVEGVEYGVYHYPGLTGSGWEGTADGYAWQAGDEWLIIASYDDWSSFGDDPIEVEGSDYALDSIGNPGWWFPAFTDEPCVVSPEEPAWTDPSTGNTRDGYWTTADQEGIKWRVIRYTNAKVKVTATALPGYVIPEGAVTQWQRIDR